MNFLTYNLYQNCVTLSKRFYEKNRCLLPKEKNKST